MTRLKSGRGGPRPGAGRPALPNQTSIHVRISKSSLAWLDAQPRKRSAVLESLIQREILEGVDRWLAHACADMAGRFDSKNEGGA